MKEKMSLMDKVKMGLGKCFKSEQKVQSNLVATLIGPDGLIKDIRTVHNTVTTAGKYGAADQILASPSLTKPGWMEVGTGTGTGRFREAVRHGGHSRGFGQRG